MYTESTLNGVQPARAFDHLLDRNPVTETNGLPLDTVPMGSASSENGANRGYTHAHGVGGGSTSDEAPPEEEASQSGYTGTNPFIRDSMRGNEFMAKERPPVMWLIDGLLPENKLFLLHGPTEVNKSWLFLDMGIAVASGTPWAGQKTTAGPVIIISLELAEWELKERVNKQLQLRFGDDTTKKQACLDNLVLVGEDTYERPTDIIRDHEKLTEMVKYYEAVMIMFDPLNKLHKVNENNSDDVAKIMAAFDYIRLVGKCVVAFVHHHKKAVGKGNTLYAVRGSARFTDDVKFAVSVSLAPSDSSTRKVTPDKVSGGEKPKAFWFKAFSKGPFGGAVQHDPNYVQSLADILLDIVEDKPGLTRKELCQSNERLNTHNIGKPLGLLVDREELVEVEDKYYRPGDEPKSI